MTAHDQTAESPPLKIADFAFLVVLVAVVLAVFYIGFRDFRETLKVDDVRENAAQVVTWLQEAQVAREEGKPVAPLACARSGTNSSPAPATAAAAAPAAAAPAPVAAAEGSGAPAAGAAAPAAAAAAPQAPAPSARGPHWEACVSALQSAGQPFAEFKNPLVADGLVFGNKCDRSELKTMGSIVFEKGTAGINNGQPIIVYTPIEPHESIASEVLLRVTVCGRGFTVFHVAELKF
jgi:uncharacterized protein (UPF0333 family)